MKYTNVIPGTFLERPNRFIARVCVNGGEEVVHVKNTGRCKELLIPGCRVYLSGSANLNRKTKYDLIAVEKQRVGQGPLLINMDSQIPNDVTAEWLPESRLFPSDCVIRREVTSHRSRFDFMIENASRKCFLEVKGVTLEQNGVAMFPDAPTERGVRHIQELIQCRSEGWEACLLFVIQMKEIHSFCPNDATHPQFGQVLREASEAGVRILAMDCHVTPESIVMGSPVTIRFSSSGSK